MYNGWKNYETWNVALWIGNDEGLYRSALEYVQVSDSPTYRDFIGWLELPSMKTPDNVRWLDDVLDYPRLTEMLEELAAG